MEMYESSGRWNQTILWNCFQLWGGIIHTPLVSRPVGQVRGRCFLEHSLTLGGSRRKSDIPAEEVRGHFRELVSEPVVLQLAWVSELPETYQGRCPALRAPNSEG